MQFLSDPVVDPSTCGNFDPLTHGMCSLCPQALSYESPAAALADIQGAVTAVAGLLPAGRGPADSVTDFAERTAASSNVRNSDDE